ncbi:disks large-associated protein 3 [Erpetoichthys calabaricus]|uniref:disks large-associated protein 3 n=1 Tax=Erpetoichthys calabaricus TaxID=27687 RepID=UPI0022340FDA|nr:disks large-associated protein 3 [Erpetoichthys calabaricus]
MKGYHVSGSLSQHSDSGPCQCIPEDCATPRDYMPITQDPRMNFDPYPVLNDHYFPHSSGRGTDTVPGGGTFPRSHLSQSFDPCEECLATSAHHQASFHPTVGKIHRLPPSLLDQFEKQLPFHPDGFHTLQYQRAASGEQRSESPSRIRHLVHSVQRLFAKSHSLEAPSKREYNGTRSDSRAGSRGEEGYGQSSYYHSHHHAPRHSKRSKSKDRRSGELRQRSKTAGWWSSDDNLDSDSSYLLSAAGRGGLLPILDGKGKGQGECIGCSTMAQVSEGGHSLKRSAWSSMTVSQAREAYPGPGFTYEKAMSLQESGKTKERPYHYLQVPSDDWGSGYPAGGKDGGEIPCRRMRSGSYIKAMGDDDSADSDTSTKASPKAGLSLQREAFQRSMSMDQRSSKYSCKQCSESYPCNRATCFAAAKVNARSHSYTRSLTTSQLADSLNRQYGAICESVFGEVESQAVDALDLPGCFRMRSHSYIRAIQAGCSQDDDCLSVFSLSAPQGQMKSGAMFSYHKGPPPLPPRIAKPAIAVTAQSSTESTQDAYYQSSQIGRPKPQSISADSLDLGKVSRDAYYQNNQNAGRSKSNGNSAESLDGGRLSGDASYHSNQASGRPKPHSNSTESLDGGRSSRDKYYQTTTRAKSHSNSTDGLDGGRALRESYYQSSQTSNRSKLHSSSADSLLERGRALIDRATSEGERAGPTKSSSLSSSTTTSKLATVARQRAASEEHKAEARHRKWRPSIAVQVDSSETLSDSDTESKALREVHSIGVQVEEDKRRARFKRSNSVTASVQADLELEGFTGISVATEDKALQFGHSFQRHSSEPECAEQYMVSRTVHTQGQWAYREDYHAPFESVVSTQTPLNQERSWSEGPRSLPNSGRASPCLRDAEFFLRMLQAEVERMESWCQQMEREAEENDLVEEILEKIRSAVGSAQLLISQKVQQFFRLCQQSMDPTVCPQPTLQDLAGFWDLLQLSIEDVRIKFQELQRLKDNGWKISERKEDKKAPPPLPKKPSNSATSRLAKAAASRDRSLDLGERQRQEARRRLLAAKRAASFRQNSATESADSIEIYIPEAQTRL